jgi:hypothetical protein
MPDRDNQRRTAPHGDPMALDSLGTPPSRKFLGAFTECEPPTPEPERAVRVSAVTVDGKSLGEWVTHEDGRDDPGGGAGPL